MRFQTLVGCTTDRELETTLPHPAPKVFYSIVLIIDLDGLPVNLTNVKFICQDN
jgi:hypothetical protein